MARVELRVKQGATGRFTLRWAGTDLTLYNVYIQFRRSFASSTERAAETPLIDLSLVNGSSTGNAIAYGPAVEGIQDSLTVVIPADKTALLINQDYNAETPSHKADVLLVKKTDATANRIRIAEFDVFVEPRVTVVS